MKIDTELRASRQMENGFRTQCNRVTGEKEECEIPFIPGSTFLAKRCKTTVPRVARFPRPENVNAQAPSCTMTPPGTGSQISRWHTLWSAASIVLRNIQREG